MGSCLCLVYLLFVLLSKISGTSIRTLLQTNTLWPLAVIFPSFLFGKVMGLITINLLAFATPSLRWTFEEEVSETGRHDFSKAMGDLSKALAIFGVITLIGAFAFLYFK